MEPSEINGVAAKARIYQKEVLQRGDVVLAIDLDNTLAHYKDGLVGLLEITRKLGVPDSEAKKAIRATEERNFSFRLLYQILSLKTHIFVSEDQFLALTKTWFVENYELYDDAHEFLYQYLERVPIVVVTAGDEEFQHEKIQLLGFVPNETIVVPVGTPKMTALKEVSERYKKVVVFIDDNPNEFAHIHFDAWFSFPSTSYSVRMRRSDSPHEKSKRNHLSNKVRTINSFADLKELGIPQRGVA